MRVVLAEDNPQLQEQFKLIIQALGDVPVFVAATEQAATSWLDAHPNEWDLALLDIFLAEGNGFNVLKHCARRARHQKVAVVSNYASDPIRDRTLAAGADAFFDKHSELEMLLDFYRKAKESIQ